MKATCPTCKRRIRIHKSRNIQCSCGHTFNYSDLYNNVSPIYLIDANICIYSINKHPKYGKDCTNLIKLCNVSTTDTVMREVRGYLCRKLHIFKTPHITPEIEELKTNKIKQPSIQDKSLLQCALKHPEISGIITYDKDFKNIATSGIINTHSSNKNFWVGNAHEFLKENGFK